MVPIYTNISDQPLKTWSLFNLDARRQDEAHGEIMFSSLLPPPTFCLLLLDIFQTGGCMELLLVSFAYIPAS